MASYRDKLPASGGGGVISVQRSTVSVAGTSINVTIAPVDPGKTYVRHSARYADSAVGRDACYNVELINSTTVMVTRDATASISVYPLVSLEVVSDSSCTVQRGTSATATTITIQNVMDRLRNAGAHPADGLRIKPSLACRAVPKSSTPSSNGNEEVQAGLSPEIAGRIIGVGAECDKIVASLDACQAYAESLQK